MCYPFVNRGLVVGAGEDLGDNALDDAPTDDPLVEEPKALPQYDRNELQEQQPYAERLHNSILKSDYFTEPGTPFSVVSKIIDFMCHFIK